MEQGGQRRQAPGAHDDQVGAVAGRRPGDPVGRGAGLGAAAAAGADAAAAQPEHRPLDQPLGEGELDIAGMLGRIADSGFDGPVSMEIEFVDYEYPPWEACVDAARRGKAYFDSIS